jgi:hypothetical protein
MTVTGVPTQRTDGYLGVRITIEIRQTTMALRNHDALRVGQIHYINKFGMRLSIAASVSPDELQLQ